MMNLARMVNKLLIILSINSAKNLPKSYICDMKKIYLLALLILTLLSCSEVTTSVGKSEVLYSPRYASRFELLSRGDSVILRVKNPWQGASGETFDYFISGDARRIICMSSSHIAFLDELQESDRIVGVSGVDFLYSDTHKNKADVGFDRAIKYEMIMGLKSDLMTVYEVAGENSAQTEKLKQLGMNVVQIADYLEEDPLGRAEWIVAFGAMVGKQKEAIEAFDSIESRYKKALQLTKKQSVKVMLNSPYKDVWYMPGDSSYMIRLISDAGGEYLGKGVKESKSRPISVETAYAMLLQADVWLNPSAHIKTKEQLKSENLRFKEVKAEVFSNVKRNTEAGGSDFWESGVVKPDIILRDLQKIFSSKGKVETDSLYYFIKF